MVPPPCSAGYRGPRGGGPKGSISACAMMWTSWHLQRLCSNLICKEPSLQFLVPVTPKRSG